MTPVFFCAESSRARDEPRYATAPRVDSWLLLEHPAGWSAKAFPDDRLPESVRTRIGRLASTLKHNRRLLIRQSYSTAGTRKCFIVRSDETRTHAAMVELKCYEDLLELDAAALFDQPAGRLYHDPMFLVCTHGKHDKCCALFGFATYRALRAVAGAAVWQCSHVGGDRFAANVICLPDGIYYGHVMPEDASELVEAHRSRRISLRHYRGRTCYGRAAQAAEYFVRHESGILGVADLRLMQTIEMSQEVVVCRFASRTDDTIHEVEVESRRSSEMALMTCHAVRPESLREFVLTRYRTVRPD